MHRSTPWVLRLAGGALSAGLLGLLTTPVTASPVSLSLPVQATTPTTGFTATLTATGSITVSGNGQVEGGFLGDRNFTLPNQTRPITLAGGSISVAANSDGTVALTYENDAANVAPISIDAATIDLLNGSTIPIAFNPINVSASVDIGITDVDLDLTVNAGGTIDQLVYNSSAPSATLPPGSNPGSYALPGAFDIGGNVSATGTGEILGFDFSLGSLLDETINETVDAFSGGGLPGIAELTALASPNPAMDDLAARFYFPDLGLPIPLDVDESGTVSETNSGAGFGEIKFFNLNYSVSLDLVLSNISYDVTGTANNAVVVPEPGSILLAGLGLLGLVAARPRRRK